MYNIEIYETLSYFMKQTQKTPTREIEKAKKYLEDYKKRSDFK